MTILPLWHEVYCFLRSKMDENSVIYITQHCENDEMNVINLQINRSANSNEFIPNWATRQAHFNSIYEEWKYLFFACRGLVFTVVTGLHIRSRGFRESN